MSKAFSVASWNVEHFKSTRGQSPENERVRRVISYLKAQDPDIFGIYEVVGKDVYLEMVEQFPRYTFEITEGPETQEILVGFRNTLTCFLTQKIQFKSGVPYMRPGLLASIRLDGVDYSLLFLHLASFPKPRGFGLRDDMLHKAVKFRHVLDTPAGGKHRSNYIFVGDLNTMGMKYPFEKDIDANLELAKWEQRARRYYGMASLEKTMKKTWRGNVNDRIEESNLDHVYASTNLKFKEFERNGVKGDVDVRGWVDEPDDNRKDRWTQLYSDHSLLYFELQKV